MPVSLVADLDFKKKYLTYIVKWGIIGDMILYMIPYLHWMYFYSKLLKFGKTNSTAVEPFDLSPTATANYWISMFTIILIAKLVELYFIVQGTRIVNYNPSGSVWRIKSGLIIAYLTYGPLGIGAIVEIATNKQIDDFKGESIILAIYCTLFLVALTYFLCRYLKIFKVDASVFLDEDDENSGFQPQSRLNYKAPVTFNITPPDDPVPEKPMDSEAIMPSPAEPPPPPPPPPTVAVAAITPPEKLVKTSERSPQPHAKEKGGHHKPKETDEEHETHGEHGHGHGGGGHHGHHGHGGHHGGHHGGGGGHGLHGLLGRGRGRGHHGHSTEKVEN